MTIIVQVDGLTIQAGPKAVLQDAELVVPRGAIVALVGPSGGGKTTLLQALVGHLGRGLRRSAGSVAVDGRDPFKLAGDALRSLRRTRVALVAQDPMSQLCPAHRVQDIVGELAPTSERDAAIAHALSRAGLADSEQLRRRRACELSGGQLRRLALARALVRAPALLLLDEPTGGLDAPRTRALAAQLRALAADGTAIVLASHDIDHVHRVADTVVAITHGRSGPASPRAPRQQRARRPTTSSSATRLQATSVHALAGGREVLSDLSFTVASAATLALVGPSGCGKTTLLRYLAGLTAGSGEVLLDGRPLARRVRDRGTERGRIQYVAQDPLGALNPARNVASTLTRPLRRLAGLSNDAAAQTARELLKTVDLSPELLDRHPHALSGGQRQRIALARALAANPDVLLCDEITAALDEHTSNHVLHTLHTHQQHTGLTIIWATHDLTLATNFADTILDLNPNNPNNTPHPIGRQSPRPRTTYSSSDAHPGTTR